MIRKKLKHLNDVIECMREEIDGHKSINASLKKAMKDLGKDLDEANAAVDAYRNSYVILERKYKTLDADHKLLCDENVTLKIKLNDALDRLNKEVEKNAQNESGEAVTTG